MILEMLQSGEKCACVLLEKLEIVQSTLSHHMKILVESEVVSARKQGKWTYYSISATGSEIAKKLLQELTMVMIDETDKSNEKYCK
jgi:ArsR family transcriptional regulator